jgi:hypothetical protein
MKPYASLKVKYALTKSLCYVNEYTICGIVYFNSHTENISTLYGHIKPGS